MIPDLIAGYWHKDGLDLYRYIQGKPVRIAGGSLETLKPVRGMLQQIVLIVGRDRLLHVRKRYPPAAREKLLQAVELELGELFPFTQPGYYCRIFQSYAAYTELDIWAWESESYEQLKKILPFHYVIPEDVAFSPSEAEVFLWTAGEATNILAMEKTRFLSAVSHPVSGLREEDIERFLKSLDPFGTEIRKIRIYGEYPFSLKFSPLLTVVTQVEGGYPPCLDSIPAIALREFRVSRDWHFSFSPGLLFRVVIYCILGYGLMLYLTLQNYQWAASDLQQASRRIDQRIRMAEPNMGTKTIDYSESLKELKEKLNAQPSPVSALDMLARSLPKESYLSSVILNQNTLEVWISTRDPLAVLKALNSQKKIRNVQLKGPLNMEAKSGQYSFNVTIDIAG